MLRIGLTGGIATGKNLVSNYFSELGAYVIDYDKIARSVVEPGLPAWNDIVKYFGKDILQIDNQIDRPKLGMIVFNDINKKKKLESFTHPRIIEEAKKQENEIINTDPNAIIIHNIPLLFETGLDKNVDITVAIHTDKRTQLERLMKRDGISEEYAKKRIDAHLSSQEKTKRADFIIDNNSSMEETQRQVRELYSKFCSLNNENHI